MSNWLRLYGGILPCRPCHRWEVSECKGSSLGSTRHHVFNRFNRLTLTRSKQFWLFSRSVGWLDGDIVAYLEESVPPVQLDRVPFVRSNEKICWSHPIFSFLNIATFSLSWDSCQECGHSCGAAKTAWSRTAWPWNCRKGCSCYPWADGLQVSTGLGEIEISFAE